MLKTCARDWAATPESVHVFCERALDMEVPASQKTSPLFRAVARDFGCQFGLLDEVHRINEEQRQRFMKKVRGALWTLKKKASGHPGARFQGWD